MNLNLNGYRRLCSIPVDSHPKSLKAEQTMCHYGAHQARMNQIKQTQQTHINYHMLFSGCSFTASFFSCDIRLRLTYMSIPYSVAPLSLMMFSSSESDVRYTRLLDLAIVAAMSFAVYASQPAAARTLMRRSSMKPGLFSMASPIRRAEVASPSARMIVDFLSCFACSTTYFARSASCCAATHPS